MIVAFTHWLIKWRYAVLPTLLCILAILGYGVKNLSFTNDYRMFFGSHNPQLQAFENLQNTYTKNDNLLFMLEPSEGQIFEKKTLRAILALTEAAWQLPYSIRVDSISNFQHTYASGDELTVEDLITDVEALDSKDLLRIKEIALDEPLLRNRLISPKADVTGINVVIQLPGIDPTNEPLRVVEPARKLARQIEADYPHIKVYLSGIVMMNNAFPEATQQDMHTLIPLAFVIIVLGLLLFMRSLAGTIATILVIVMSIIAAMGTTGWLGIKLTPPSATAPTMILTLAVADCVHLMTSFLFAMRQGMSRNNAIVESMRINFHPVFLTSLTTAIGFLTLNFSDVPPFHDLGNITAMGVGFAFIISVLLLPTFLASVPIKIKTRKYNTVHPMERLADMVIARRRPLLWTSSIIIILLAAFIPRNELNDVFVEYFDKSVIFRHHTDHITEKLTGLYFIDYSFDSGQSSGISEPAFLQKLKAFADWYRQQPEALHVTSLATTMQRLNKNMHGDDPRMYVLPDSRELAAQYLLLYEMSLPYGLDLNNQIDIDKAATRVSVTLKTLSSNEMIAVEQRADTWLQSNAPELHTHGASPSVMFAHIGQRNIKSMLIGTSVALLLISLILIIALRSFKFGLISLLPNLLPAFVGFGVWGLWVGQIGLSLSVVASMTLGIVVDDTIHFLSKYRRARREKQLSSPQAVRYAFASVGLALIITTVVLAGGFLVLSLSSFAINSGMGMLTSITISLALLIDFLFLPPLLMQLEEHDDAQPAHAH